LEGREKNDMMHRVPIHLEQEERIFWVFTTRQVIILALGLILGYTIFLYFDLSQPVTFVLGWMTFALILLGAGIVAFKRVAHRDLEVWALVALAYMLRPRIWLWSPRHISFEDIASEETLAFLENMTSSSSTEPQEQESEEDLLWD